MVARYNNPRVTMRLEMSGCNGVGNAINSFALISYLPEPMAGFLDSLRCELVPRCQAKTHVTILPPRPLASGVPEDAWSDLNDSLNLFPPFRVELTSVEVFAGTNVIYISIGAGFRELEQMHAALNQGPLQFDEPYKYHPHVTLAQQLSAEQVEAAAALARRRWREFPYSRSFTVDRLTFVQNTEENRWADLAGRVLSIRKAS
jgi:2'-5' RNA ligase